jgi:hypothetical protein
MVLKAVISSRLRSSLHSRHEGSEPEVFGDEMLSGTLWSAGSCCKQPNVIFITSLMTLILSVECLFSQAVEPEVSTQIIHYPTISHIVSQFSPHNLFSVIHLSIILSSSAWS